LCGTEFTKRGAHPEEKKASEERHEREQETPAQRRRRAHHQHYDSFFKTGIFKYCYWCGNPLKRGTLAACILVALVLLAGCAKATSVLPSQPADYRLTCQGCPAGKNTISLDVR
jgi:hypothetical protein